MQLSAPKPIFPSLSIGQVMVEAPVFLAPLAGITDRSFRLICRRAGAGMVFTEMVSAEAIVRNQEKTWNLALFTEAERPVGIQLFSHDPEVLGQAAARLEGIRPDVIDLNFGCPVRKVVRRGAGAGFMEDLERLSEAVRQVVRNTTRPVTVKIRSGPTADRLNAVEAAQRAEDAGAAAVTVHGRTTAQGFRGAASWDIIGEVKHAVSIAVIGNGDVTTPGEMQELMKSTGCDGIMIGRGTYGNPWIFDACRAHLENRLWTAPSPARRWELIKLHLTSAVADKGLYVGVREMRKHLGWYSKGMPGAAQFRARVFRMTEPEEIIAFCEQFFLTRISSEPDDE